MNHTLLIGALTGLLLASTAASWAAQPPENVSEIFDRVRAHDFNPLDDRSFTVDRNLKRHGIADNDDSDWRVRLLAVRDLVLAGQHALPRIAQGLTDDDMQVRYVCAAALGVLRNDQAVPDLERVVRDDPERLVRSQAVIALGQIGSQGSLSLLRDRLANDPARDVQHQCELSIDQIEKGMGATDELLAAYRSLDPETFETVRVGEPAPDFSLPDTDGDTHRLSDLKGGWVVLIWVFADWCPVCHGEFRELIAMRDDFARAGVKVLTIETHDRYRARVMVGKEVDPKYWFAKESFQETYTEKIWWPHLLDRAGAVGATYGVDPMAFSVHAEYINRPSTIIIDPAGNVRLAYYGTFWGDRPSIEQTLEMIQNEHFQFEHPKRLQK